MVDLRNRVQWGNAVTVPRSVLPTASMERFPVFDTGTNLFAVPQVITLTLDLSDPSGDGSIWFSDDIWWAEIEIGLGGYRRTITVDWYIGQQLSFAANSVRVIGLRRVGLGTESAKLRCSLAVGGRSSNARPPTYTSVAILPQDFQVPVDAPVHAKSFRLLANSDVFITGLTVIQDGQPPISVTLTQAEIRDLVIGKFEMPVMARRQMFQVVLPNTSYMRVAYSLDL